MKTETFEKAEIINNHLKALNDYKKKLEFVIAINAEWKEKGHESKDLYMDGRNYEGVRLSFIDPIEIAELSLSKTEKEIKKLQKEFDKLTD